MTTLPQISFRSLCRLAGALTLSFLVGGAGLLRAADAVGAIGYIKPAGGIISLAGSGGDTVVEIMVQEGQKVKAGQLMVRFRDEPQMRARLEVAQLALAEADEGGAYTVELARLAEEVATESHKAAEARLARYMQLEPTSISPQESDVRENMVLAAGMNLKIAKQNHEQAKFARKLAMAQAKNELQQTELNLAKYLMPAPYDGTLVEVFAVPGLPANLALVQIADLTEMIVMAQVFEGDILKVKEGDKATISNASLPEPIQAVVEKIGRQVSGGARVAQVRLKLANPELAARFIGMEVNVTIEP
jgi:HlyD family secretion protein